MSISFEISMEIKKFKDSLIGLKTMLEEIERIKIIERSKAKKQFKKITREVLKELEIKKQMNQKSQKFNFCSIKKQILWETKQY